MRFAGATRPRKVAGLVVRTAATMGALCSSASADQQGLASNRLKGGSMMVAGNVIEIEDEVLIRPDPQTGRRCSLTGDGPDADRPWEIRGAIAHQPGLYLVCHIDTRERRVARERPIAGRETLPVMSSVW
jgi:hypothetical protein